MLEITDERYTDEQKAYIRKYAAGFLLANNLEMIMGTITPDIMDGFEPPVGLFPDVDEDDVGGEDDLVYEGTGEVLSLLDNWLEEIVKLAGFESLDEATKAVGDTETVYGKYPVMGKA